MTLNPKLRWKVHVKKNTRGIGPETTKTALANGTEFNRTSREQAYTPQTSPKANLDLW